MAPYIVEGCVVRDFIPYYLRQKGERMLHIGFSGTPLCGAILVGEVERIYLPAQLGMAHGVCADCRNMYLADRPPDSRN